MTSACDCESYYHNHIHNWVFYICRHALSPFSIMTTLALSTGAIANLAVLLAFYYLLAGT